jgi:osmotically-inducible protein OsmY
MALMRNSWAIKIPFLNVPPPFTFESDPLKIPSDSLRTKQVKLNLKRWMLTGLAVSAVVSSLSACAPLVVGSAVMSGMVAIDRRTAGIQLEDEGIELRTAQGLRQNLSAASHVNVTSYNRMVLLTGEVSSAAEKERAERLAKSQENVSSVVNDLAIEPASSLTQRSKDAITTGQIKALLVDAKDLQSNAFKVVTERGIVYLMGRVTPREAQRASEIARSGSVSGVVKVVRVFETITEEELKRISAQPLSPQAQPKI